MEYLPDRNYMAHHPDLDWRKRALLIEWVMSIHGSTTFHPESFYLFVNTLDRFCSKHRNVSTLKYQLVGIACFMIACKFEETMAPTVHDMHGVANDTYTVEEILKAEQYVLKILGWELNFAGPLTWLRRGSKADGMDSNCRTLAKYFLDVACMERSLVAVPPSLIAASSLWLARLALCKGEWVSVRFRPVSPTLILTDALQNHNLRHYAGYEEREIIPIANRMLTYLAKPIEHEIFFRKYASKRYKKVFHADLLINLQISTSFVVFILYASLGAQSLGGRVHCRSG
jgi:G2/mitotic-specific cyclin 1/2